MAGALDSVIFVQNILHGLDRHACIPCLHQLDVFLPTNFRQPCLISAFSTTRHSRTQGLPAGKLPVRIHVLPMALPRIIACAWIRVDCVQSYRCPTCCLACAHDMSILELRPHWLVTSALTLGYQTIELPLVVSSRGG